MVPLFLYATVGASHRDQVFIAPREAFKERADNQVVLYANIVEEKLLGWGACTPGEIKVLRPQTQRFVPILNNPKLTNLKECKSLSDPLFKVFDGKKFGFWENFVSAEKEIFPLSKEDLGQIQEKAKALLARSCEMISLWKDDDINLEKFDKAVKDLNKSRVFLYLGEPTSWKSFLETFLLMDISFYLNGMGSEDQEIKDAIDCLDQQKKVFAPLNYVEDFSLKCRGYKETVFEATVKEYVSAAHPDPKDAECYNQVLSTYVALVAELLSKVDNDKLLGELKDKDYSGNLYIKFLEKVSPRITSLQGLLKGLHWKLPDFTKKETFANANTTPFKELITADEVTKMRSLARVDATAHLPPQIANLRKLVDELAKLKTALGVEVLIENLFPRGKLLEVENLFQHLAILSGLFDKFDKDQCILAATTENKKICGLVDKLKRLLLEDTPEKIKKNAPTIWTKLQSNKSSPNGIENPYVFPIVKSLVAFPILC